MKLLISILSLYALLASPFVYAADSGTGTTTGTSADDKMKKGDGEEEPECD